MASFFLRYRRIILFLVAVAVFFWLVWILRNVLIPFALGLILAYLLLPPIQWLEKKLPRQDRRWHAPKRVTLILLAYLLIIAVLGVIGYFTIPPIIKSIGDFFANSPTLISDAIKAVQDWTDSIRQQVPPEMRDQIDGYITQAFDAVGNAVQATLLRGLSYITASLGIILGFVSLPVFVFFILKDAEDISSGFYASLSAWSAEQARSIMGIIQDVLGRYIRTQIILGVIVGLLDFTGLMILGVPFAPALGIWAGITELIPLIGPWLGGAAGVIVALATVPDKALWVLLLYGLVQILENSFLVPRIAGEILQIHPAVILVLIVVAGHFAGVWGIVLIVPVSATLVRLYRYVVRATRKEELQGPGG